MLSYRHSFHAGNFADVLKHLVLVNCLRYLLQKDKPLFYLDTHAGAGGYALGSTHASTTLEYENGIGRLWGRNDLPGIVADYVALVRRFNNGKRLSHYPGSPWFAGELLRPGDRMVLHELHPADFAALRESMGGDRRVRVLHEDGYQGCVALLPPTERRGLTLIDPSYELKADYPQVVETLQQAHRRFATGTFALWYPVVERYRIERLEKALQASGMRKVLLLELGICADRPGHGMSASGMIVVNPPWTLKSAMMPALEYLAKRLGEQGGGHCRVEELVGE